MAAGPVTPELMWGYDRERRRWMFGTWSAPDPHGWPVPAGEVVASFAVDDLAAIAPRGRRTVADAVMRESGLALPAEAFDGVPGEWQSMTCPVCWMVSFTAEDAAVRYCGHCHWATGDPTAGPPPGDQEGRP